MAATFTMNCGNNEIAISWKFNYATDICFYIINFHNIGKRKVFKVNSGYRFLHVDFKFIALFLTNCKLFIWHI